MMGGLKIYSKKFMKSKYRYIMLSVHYDQLANLQCSPFIMLLIVIQFWIYFGHVLAPKWLFFYSFLVKLPLYNRVHL